MRFLLFLILCPILLLASDNASASGENYIVRRDYLNAAGKEYVDVVEYPYGMLMDGVWKRFSEALPRADKVLLRSANMIRKAGLHTSGSL